MYDPKQAAKTQHLYATQTQYAAAYQRSEEVRVKAKWPPEIDVQTMVATCL